eukprot:TRINITY_DN1543_c0_g1_i7.p1 TRINITY_DN1543_c0_g1~~TRINITY_DN1543_c0_g1_i7.p1  ORF type:complete len:1270 (+),score=321.45 TRINITY_DN1543_c0_g1_i7:127-3936(+)
MSSFMFAGGVPATFKNEFSKQVWEGSKNVIVSTKKMMMLVNEGSPSMEAFTSASSEVAINTKKLIVLMFSPNTTSPPSEPVFTQQFLFDSTKALKSYILNLINDSKACIQQPTSTELKDNLNIWCKKVTEIIKNIMLTVQPQGSNRPGMSRNASEAAISRPIHTVMGPSVIGALGARSAGSGDSTLTPLSSSPSSYLFSPPAGSPGLSRPSSTPSTSSVALGSQSQSAPALSLRPPSTITTAASYNSSPAIQISNEAAGAAHTNTPSATTSSSSPPFSSHSRSSSVPAPSSSHPSAVSAVGGTHTTTPPPDAYLSNSSEEEEEEEEELDFVVSALNVFGALDDLRSAVRAYAQQGTPDPKRFLKTSHIVTSSTSELLDAARQLKLSQAVPHLERSYTNLAALVASASGDPEGGVGPLADEGERKRLERAVRELEDGVGECVDAFRNLGPGKYVSSDDLQAGLPKKKSTKKKHLTATDAHTHDEHGDKNLPIRPASTNEKQTTALVDTLAHSHFTNPSTNITGNRISPRSRSLSPPPYSPSSRTSHPHALSSPPSTTVPALPASGPSATTPLTSMASSSGAKGKGWFPLANLYKNLHTKADKSSSPYINITDTLKMCFLGEQASGKTVLLKRLLYDNFNELYETTVTEELHERVLDVDSETIKLEVFDISGSHPASSPNDPNSVVIANPSHNAQNFEKWFSWAECFVLVYRVTSISSWRWVQYWIEQVAKIKETMDFPFIIVGTHLDQEGMGREVLRDVVENYIRHLPGISHPPPYLEVSAKSMYHVYKIFPLLLAYTRMMRKLKPKRASKAAMQKVEMSKRRERRQSLTKGLAAAAKKMLSGPTGDKDDWSSTAYPTEDWVEGLPGSRGAPAPAYFDWHLIDVSCRIEGFHIESGLSTLTTQHPFLHSTRYANLLFPSLLATPYKDLFLGKDHLIFVGQDSVEGPVIASVLLPPVPSPGQNIPTDFAKAIIRTRREDRRIWVPIWSSTKELLRTLRIISAEMLYNRGGGNDRGSGSGNRDGFLGGGGGIKLNLIKDLHIRDAIATYEDQMIIKRLKFGVLFSYAHQTDENAMFGNCDNTPEFTTFLNTIGDTITMKGWPRFRGGLDHRNNATGEQSVYTEFAKIEIMFHVSTMLPFQPDDVQKVERKRHIGNDIVVIIFRQPSSESPALFSPLMLTSKFNHIFCVVSPTQKGGKTYYRIQIGNKPGVLPYPPFLPEDCLLEPSVLRDFLMTKLINAEMAATESPEFKNKMMRTRRALLEQILQEHSNAK